MEISTMRRTIGRGCGCAESELPWIDTAATVFSLETFRSRTGFAAAVSLALLGTASVLLVLLTDRTWRIVAAAAIWAGAAAVLSWLALRAHGTERARREQFERVETRQRAPLEGLPP